MYFLLKHSHSSLYYLIIFLQFTDFKMDDQCLHKIRIQTPTSFYYLCLYFVNLIKHILKDGLLSYTKSDEQKLGN